MIGNDWLVEHDAASGVAAGLRVQHRLHAEQGRGGAIEVLESSDHGRVLVHDGRALWTSKHHFLHHEMMAHPALFTHSFAKRVLVVANDGGTLGEILRHDMVEAAIQLVDDERLHNIAQDYFPALSGARDDARVTSASTDTNQYLDQSEEDSLDVVIVDSLRATMPDPGPFGAPFHAACLRVLRRGGILVSQSGSPLWDMQHIAALHQGLREAGFASVRTLTYPRPVRPGGWASCTLARKESGLDSFRERAATIKPFATRYYSAAVHHAALASPPFLSDALQA